MTAKTKTIRLIVPDWQAGDQPVYQTGANVLAAIAPNQSHQPEIRIDVPKLPRSLPIENGVVGQAIVRETTQRTMAAIQAAVPDRIITLGGNCLVSQAPFAYLNERYAGNLGVIWLDAHPDISNPEIFNHEHAMVLGNLLHAGDPKLAQLVPKKLEPNQVYLAGLQVPTLAEQTELKRLGISYQVQTQAELDLAPIVAWVKRQRFDHVALHFDIDVLDPTATNFYDTYLNNPNLGSVPANAAKGRLYRQSVWQAVAQLGRETNLVGLTLAEYLPWSAQQLVDLMAATPIFS